MILSATAIAAADSVGSPRSEISPLVVGLVAPIIVLPILLLWSGRDITHDELASVVIRTIAGAAIRTRPEHNGNGEGCSARLIVDGPDGFTTEALRHGGVDEGSPMPDTHCKGTHRG